ncbi:MAG: UDP-N-acetylenolpyruvoylglucosamine reductase [Candidatus Nealsonbacteria bacterium CG02_land_8_20_14_3_00_40_11]|uniref:UDP-N-acetylenolpyruvoylglucosamine reductase n=1 Tax=Candidatus Nealsonbacteria bacterium CG02_land_8_20_14_3_00_40_11 TaxID=1974700 RepID=A0A2M7D817_9BACT|nr:MAG: UDP-N-acetylenolpyruvoylglucosamine reductase [Candidatus Nealsonbacteria bacterium CG02_land_8_20_14_3_00_40_11]
MTIDKSLPGIQKNILLKNFTTFKIGGKAKYFYVAKTKKDLILTIKTAKELKLPFFILGGGSNLLISDDGFKGLVIKILFSKFYFLNSKIIAEAGTRLGDLVGASMGKSLTGLEWAAGIPGTVGGAINGNAGLPNESAGDIVKEIEAFDLRDFKIKKFKNKDCKFSYRDSVFKHKKNLIILSAALQLKKGNKNKITEKIKKYLEYKKNTQPLDYPSAGSVFKNPKGFSAARTGKEDKSSSLSFTAARMIEECGLKGKKIGNAKISEKHANFIVNLGSARAKDVEKLIKLMKQKVKNKFGAVLEEEITVLS